MTCARHPATARLGWALLAGLACGVATESRAEDAGQAVVGPAEERRPAGPVELLQASSADPLELARVVDRTGDGPIVRALAAAGPVQVRLQAIYAARWLRSPEAALPALIHIMGGRDPALAPAAARAVLRIAEMLDARELSRREVQLADLTPQIEALKAVGEKAHLRPDLRGMAHAAAAMLADVATAAPQVGDTPAR